GVNTLKSPWWVGLQALVKKKTIGTRCGNGCSDGSHRSDQHLSKAIHKGPEQSLLSAS
ncbi:MAG: hypothetical protein ACI87A_002948, partial [Planctomycetota bacterium]